MRIFAFFLVAVVYIALWLALSLWLSVVCRRAATAALAAIALWLVLTLFAGLIAGVIADTAHNVPADATTEQVLANARLELQVRRFSPDQLYKEATGVLLNPSRQSTGIVVVQQDNGALPDEPAADRQPGAGVVAARRAHRARRGDVRRGLHVVHAPGGEGVARARATGRNLVTPSQLAFWVSATTPRPRHTNADVSVSSD